MGEKLNKSRVNENSRAERVENAGDHRRAGRAWIVRRAHAETDRNTYRCCDTIEECTNVGHVVVLGGEDEVRESGANSEAFEHFCDRVRL